MLWDTLVSRNSVRAIKFLLFPLSSGWALSHRISEFSLSTPFTPAQKLESPASTKLRTKIQISWLQWTTSIKKLLAQKNESIFIKSTFLPDIFILTGWQSKRHGSRTWIYLLSLLTCLGTFFCPTCWMLQKDSLILSSVDKAPIPKWLLQTSQMYLMLLEWIQSYQESVQTLKMFVNYFVYR